MEQSQIQEREVEAPPPQPPHPHPPPPPLARQNPQESEVKQAALGCIWDPDSKEDKEWYLGLGRQGLNG